MMDKVILICIIVALASCAVEPYEIEAAEKACEQHGGIKLLYAVPRDELVCSDGIKISNFLGS